MVCILYNNIFIIKNTLGNTGIWSGDQQMEDVEYARRQWRSYGTGPSTLSRFRSIHGRKKRHYFGRYIGRLQWWQGILRRLAARSQHAAVDMPKRVHPTVSGVLPLGRADSGGSHVYIRRYSQSEQHGYYRDLPNVGHSIFRC